MAPSKGEERGRKMTYREVLAHLGLEDTGESPAGMMHTPGPWRVDSSMVHTGWVLVTTSDGNIIANVNTETGPDIPPAVSTKMPAMNNATLISAAPRMLEVLEWLSDEYCCRDDSCGGVLFTEQDFRRVHAVIREARAK